MVGKVFISYRRDDDPSAAARVRDGLTARLGRSSVFMDVDNLLAGQRFDQELAKALAASDVLVAVIGVRWMDVLRSRATSGERDYVREEIAGALKRQIAVIPLRVGREGQLAQLPRPDELPEDIRELVLYQKQDVTHEHYGRDIAGLAEAVIAGRKGRRTEWSTARKAWLWLGVGAAVASLTIAAFFPALLPSSLTLRSPMLRNFSPLASSLASRITSSGASSVPFLRQWMGYCLPSSVRE